MKNVLYVQIMGHEYPVEASADEELYVNRLAQFIQERMTELKDESKVIDSYKLAVLTAMNIADELFRLQETKGLESKTDDLLKLLDDALAAK
jgi:cell division protein ZapA